MITASEAKKITIENIQRKEKEDEKSFEGFLDYVEKAILRESKNGKSSAKIAIGDFKRELSFKKVPDRIIANLNYLGFSVLEDSDYPDSNIIVGWKNG